MRPEKLNNLYILHYYKAGSSLLYSCKKRLKAAKLETRSVAC